MKFYVVVSGRNCLDTLPRSVMSVARQEYDGEFDICIVDNGSYDEEFTFFVKQFATKQGFSYLLLDEMASTAGMRIAVRDVIQPGNDDVLVFVSGEDYLPDVRVLAKLARLYDDPDVTVTYGDVFSHKASVCYTEENMHSVISNQFGRVLADFKER